MKKLFLAAVLASGAIAGDAMGLEAFWTHCDKNGGKIVDRLFGEDSNLAIFACRDAKANVIAIEVPAMTITDEKDVRQFERFALSVRMEDIARNEAAVEIARGFLTLEGFDITKKAK